MWSQNSLAFDMMAGWWNSGLYTNNSEGELASKFQAKCPIKRSIKLQINAIKKYIDRKYYMMINKCYYKKYYYSNLEAIKMLIFY